MTSENVLNVIAMSKIYKKRPSEILNIKDEYTSYCFDEACAIILNKMNNKEKPIFPVKGNNIESIHYNSASQLYESMGFKKGEFVRQIQ